MNHRVFRTIAIVVTLIGAAALVPGVAGADGATRPNTAPTIKVGTPYWGDTKVPADDHHDYYRLPSILAGDEVTISVLPDSALYLCLQANVDQYNWNDNGMRCNLSQEYSVSKNGTRQTIKTKLKTNKAFLHFRYYCCSTNSAYQFTVDSIRHQLAVKLNFPAKVKRGATVTMTSHRSDGSGLPNGSEVTLTLAIQGKKYRYRAKTKNGKATFVLKNLPAAVDGKNGTASVNSPRSATHLPASASAKFQVIK